MPLTGILERRVFLCRFLLVVCVGIVTVSSVLPQTGCANSTKVVFSIGLDKVLHFLAFGAIGFFAVGCLDEPERVTILAVFASVALYGVFIEGLQFFIPTRTFNPMDIAANLWGILCGAVAWRGGMYLTQRR